MKKFYTILCVLLAFLTISIVGCSNATMEQEYNKSGPIQYIQGATNTGLGYSKKTTITIEKAKVENSSEKK